MGIEVVAEVVEDVLGGGGGNVGVAICAGRGDGDAGALDEGARNGVAGDADGDGIEAGADEGGDDGIFGENEGEGAGPEVFGQDLGVFGPGGDELLDCGDAGGVDDEGVLGWAAFGGEDAGDGGGVERVCAEAVDCFGGEGDQAAVTQAFGGVFEVVFLKIVGLDGEKRNVGACHSVNPWSRLVESRSVRVDCGWMAQPCF